MNRRLNEISASQNQPSQPIVKSEQTGRRRRVKAEVKNELSWQRPAEFTNLDNPRSGKKRTHQEVVVHEILDSDEEEKQPEQPIVEPV